MYYFGLDIGQAQDYTALTIGEKVRVKQNEQNEQNILQYHARHAERFPIGTDYIEIVDKLWERINGVGILDYIVLVDATGVGKPVVDMMRKRGIKLVPIVITGGITETFDTALGGWRLPKRNLVSSLQIMLQDGQLKLARDMDFAPKLIDELLKFKIKVTAKGNDTYEAWREGDHDDLVLSLAMSVWYAMKFGLTKEEAIERRRASLRTNPWLEVKGI